MSGQSRLGQPIGHGHSLVSTFAAGPAALGIVLLAGVWSPAVAQSTVPNLKPAQVARPAAVAKKAAAAPTVTTLGLSRSKIAMDLPKGWSSEATKDADDAYVLLSPDGFTTLLLFSVPAPQMDAALSGLGEKLKGVVSEPTLQPASKGEVGGMPAMMADGTAKVDEHPVDLGVMMVLNESSQRVVFLVGFTVAKKGDAYAKDVAAILHSVRKAP